MQIGVIYPQTEVPTDPDTVRAYVRTVEELGYRPPQRRPGDRHYAEFRAIDPDGNNFDISENGYEDIRPESAEAEAS